LIKWRKYKMRIPALAYNYNSSQPVRNKKLVAADMPVQKSSSSVELTNASMNYYVPFGTLSDDSILEKYKIHLNAEDFPDTMYSLLQGEDFYLQDKLAFDKVIDDYNRLEKAQDDEYVKFIMLNMLDDYAKIYGWLGSESYPRAECFRNAIQCFANKGYKLSKKDLDKFIKYSATPKMVDLVNKNFLGNESLANRSEETLSYNQEIKKGNQTGRIKSAVPLDDYPELSYEISNRYDIYDINNWHDIIAELGESKNVIRFAIENLPDIFITDENKKQYKNIVEELVKFDGDWNIQDEKTGDNLAHRAAIAENPLLIKLANDKNVDFTQKNKSGATACEYLNQYNSNSEVAELLNNIKINYSPIVDLASKGMVSVLPLITKSTGVDINSVDKNGDNAAIAAARNGKSNVIKYLNGLDNFDINYVNPNTKKDAISSAKNIQTLNSILENPHINLNDTDGKNPPVLFRFLSDKYGVDIVNNRHDLEIFETLLEHPKINLHTKYKNLTFAEALRKYMLENDKNLKKSSVVNEEILQIINKAISRKMLENTRRNVDNKGFLTLEEVKKFVNSPNVKDIINEPLNAENESIGFFIAEIPVEFSNISVQMEVIDTLNNNNYNFCCKNKFGQTLLDKAIDAQNYVFSDFIKEKLKGE